MNSRMLDHRYFKFQFCKKGGRVGYGKGGKVSRGCGKVMAGRNKKTKYI